VSRLGSLYAQAIVGANDDTLGNVVKGYSVEDASGPYAQSVRAKLEVATDARLLLAAGSYLMNNVSNVKDVGFDPAALGRTYVARAVELEPDFPLARMSLVRADRRKVEVQAHALAKRARVESTDPAAELSDEDRFELLPIAADDLQRVSASLEPDPERLERSRVRARQYAEQAVALAEKLSSHPDRGTVLFRAHLTLGLMEIQNGNRRAAVGHVRSAAAAPASEELEWTPVGDHALTLVNRLLADGERESIAAFYDRLAAVTRVPGLRETYTKDAQSIREGRMTWSYQATVHSR
jgi:hypothetical protein